MRQKKEAPRAKHEEPLLWHIVKGISLQSPITQLDAALRFGAPKRGVNKNQSARKGEMITPNPASMTRNATAACFFSFLVMGVSSMYPGGNGLGEKADVL